MDKSAKEQIEKASDPYAGLQRSGMKFRFRGQSQGVCITKYSCQGVVPHHLPITDTALCLVLVSRLSCKLSAHVRSLPGGTTLFLPNMRLLEKSQFFVAHCLNSLTAKGVAQASPLTSCWEGYKVGRRPCKETRPCLEAIIED